MSIPQNTKEHSSNSSPCGSEGLWRDFSPSSEHYVSVVMSIKCQYSVDDDQNLLNAYKELVKIQSLKNYSLAKLTHY